MRVVVGLSGGVDSSVAAALLKEQGHDVIGVTMKLWNGKYKGGTKDACFSPHEQDDIDAAKKIADMLGIEHHVIDCADDYDKTIIQYFKDSYINGLTPNPCVRCNAEFKFGLLPLLAEKKLGKFDKFATGHYARVLYSDTACCYSLHMAKCIKKDQSYFLSRLSQDQLSKIMLPLGDFASKAEVRELARKYSFETADKDDSMDFYSGDIAELIDKPDEIGNIVDLNGRILGKHNGFWHYTIGQRHGLNISAAEPMYVVDIKSCHNAVVVGTRDQACKNSFKVKDIRWTTNDPSMTITVDVKIRSSGHNLYRCSLGMDGIVTSIEQDKPMFGVTPGQFAVFYCGDMVVGSGIIC